MGLNLRQLIQNEGIETQMQLVISPNQDYAAGIEALSRGIHPETGETVSPVVLIQMAKKEGLVLELEQLMINKALETFKPIYEATPDLLLFLNMGTEFIELCLETDLINEAINRFGIPSHNIFFDIVGFDFGRLAIVKQFADVYRQQGFFICVDDLGLDYNNLDKVLYLSPDLVKINIRALRQLENKGYAERMMQTLKLITESFGIIMVAKGIEDESDVNFTFDSGAQFMQGYYISKPIDLTLDSLKTIKDRYRDLMAPRMIEKENTLELTRMMTTKAYGIIKGIKSMILEQEMDLDQLNDAAIFDQYPMIESLWHLDNKGHQNGATWINHKEYLIKNASVFQVHTHGTDFSTKDIYTQLYDTILDVWVTPPFKSILTNNNCITCSIRMDHSAEHAVMCLNINLEKISTEQKAVKKLELDDDDFKIVIGNAE